MSDKHPTDAEAIVAALDRGEVRVAEPDGDGWRVNADVQEAILDYFRLRQVEPCEIGPFAYHDKIPLKTGYEQLGVRGVLVAHSTLLMISAARTHSASVGTSANRA